MFRAQLHCIYRDYKIMFGGPLKPLMIVFYKNTNPTKDLFIAFSDVSINGITYLVGFGLKKRITTTLDLKMTLYKIVVGFGTLSFLIK